MKTFIINNFSLVMLSGCILGLFIPNLGGYTSTAIPILLGIVIFASMFKLDLDFNALKTDLLKILVYYLLRFIVLPVVLFLSIKPFSDFYSSAIFLFTLLPVAVSAPAFTEIFKGNIPLSIVSVVFSNSLTPFVIPIMCSYFLSSTQNIDSSQMFKTLTYTILLPIILHIPFRSKLNVKKWFLSNYSLITILCISSLFTLAISKFKFQILEHIHILPIYLGISFLTYSFLYLIGWAIVPKSNRYDQISYAVGSGANNIGLGVALTILYFPAELNILFIISQIMWTLVLFPVKKVAKYIMK